MSAATPAVVAGFAFTLISMAGCTHLKSPPIPSSQCSGSAAQNKAVVLAFYELALVRRSPREAFAVYATEDMIEHKPDIPGGTRDAVVAYLEALIGELPNARWEILRSAAEGDLVFIHARFTTDKGQPSYAIADVFRVANCKIAEHWDVVGAPREQQANPVSRF